MPRFHLIDNERVQFTAEEEAQWDAMEAAYAESLPALQLANLRQVRDLKLAETDWWVLPDRTPTQEQLDYRQALRDITNTYQSLDTVVCPIKPE